MQRGEAWCFSPIFCFVGKQGKQSVKLSPYYDERQSVRFSKSRIHFCCSMKEHPSSPWIWIPVSSSTFPKAEDKSITVLPSRKSFQLHLWSGVSHLSRIVAVGLFFLKVGRTQLLFYQGHWYYSLYQVKSTGVWPALLLWGGVNLLGVIQLSVFYSLYQKLLSGNLEI